MIARFVRTKFGNHTGFFYRGCRAVRLDLANLIEHLIPGFTRTLVRRSSL